MGLLDVFKAIGRGYDKLATSGVGAMVPGLRPEDLTPEQKRYLRAALLSSIGSAIATQRPTILPNFMAYSSQVAEPIAAQKNEEALKAALAQAPTLEQKAMIAEQAGYKNIAAYFTRLAQLEAEKNQPMGAPFQIQSPSGGVQYAQQLKGGGIRPLEYSPPVKPENVDVGGEIKRINPYTGQELSSIEKTTTPDTNARINMRANELKAAEERFVKQQEMDLKKLEETMRHNLAMERTSAGRLALGWESLEQQKLAREYQMKKDQLAILKNTQKVAKDLRDMDTTLETLDKLTNYLEKNGPPTPGTPDNAKVQAWVNTIVDSYRLAKQYGALQEAEIKFLDKMFPNPATIYGYIKGSALGRNYYLSPLKELRNILAKSRDTAVSQHGLVRLPNGTYTSVEFLTLFQNAAPQAPAGQPQQESDADWIYDPVTKTLKRRQ